MRDKSATAKLILVDDALYNFRMKKVWAAYEKIWSTNFQSYNNIYIENIYMYAVCILISLFFLS
jgi:hypothetical protein